MGKEAEGRQYQDTVFRAYFNDADRLRELAGALHGRTYAASDPVKIVTLEGTFLSQVKNDISFLLAGRYLVFIEHQSTPNENMPLRCLYYVCEQLREEIDSSLLYRNRSVLLPAPEFHVFYTGTKELPEEFVMRLSDAYRREGEEKIHLELLVTVHNIVYRDRKNCSWRAVPCMTTAGSLERSRRTVRQECHRRTPSAPRCTPVWNAILCVRF